MADANRGLSEKLAAFLPLALLVFFAAAFALPTDPAYALVFYALVVVPALACLSRMPGLGRPGPALAMLLIVWSGLTVLWGHDVGHRALRFGVDSAMTLVFLLAMLAGLAEPAQRRRLMGVLIWVGAANAILSLVLGVVHPLGGERLHGWGATSHPILGASVMTIPYLAALFRTLAERPARWWHLGAAVTMAVFIVFTESRGPLLAATIATMFLCAAGPWRWRALGILAAVAVAWRLLPEGVRAHHAAVLVARGSSHRFEIWHRTLQMIGEHKLLGNGLAANLDLPGYTFPHDLYLSVLFYSGAVGFALFLALAGQVSWTLWRQRGDAAWLLLVALWMNTLLSGLTDLGQITKGPGPMWLIFWLPVGLVLTGGSARAQQSRALGGQPGVGPGAMGGEAVA